MKLAIKPVLTRNIAYQQCPFDSQFKEFPWEGQFNHILNNYTREMLAITVEEDEGEVIVGGFTLDYKEEIPELIFFEVIERRRGQGIGKKALLMLIESLKAEGYKHLFVQTGRPIIYKNLGFAFKVVDRRGLIIELEHPLAPAQPAEESTKAASPQVDLPTIKTSQDHQYPIRLIYSDYFLWHNNANHPEVASRVSYTMEYLQQTGLLNHIKVEEPRYATEEELLTTHSQELVNMVREASIKELKIGKNNYTCKDTYNIARLGFGGALLAGEEINRWGRVFVLCRPPGHHATYDQAMGFCFFNNMAGLALSLWKQGIKPFIIDWDAHHGNGTQDILYDKPIFYLSIHQKYLFPHTGFPEETGIGAGEGHNRNILVYPLCEDEDYLRAFDSIEEEIRNYDPDVLLVSAGQDGHAKDLFTGLMLSTTCYYQMARKVRRLADKYSNGQVILLLEGGYNLEILGETNANIIKAIAKLD